MSLYTIGKKYFVDYRLAIHATQDMDTLLSKEAQEYYKVIYNESGTLHIMLNDKEYILSGAHALCLNHKDRFTICETSKSEITILYFQPCVINAKFDNSVYDVKNNLFEAEIQSEYRKMNVS